MALAEDHCVLPTFILVMGVSGSGKTTVSQGISRILGGSFIEADDFHSQANITLMSSGRALQDDHRWPWLQAISCAALRQAGQDSVKPVVIACSALKRAYRDKLRDALGSISIVHLEGTEDVIRRRMSARGGHFMPAELLASQFATLEPLEPDENGIVVSVREPIADIIEDVCAHLCGKQPDRAARTLSGIGRN